MPSNHGFKLNDLKCLSLSFSGFIKLLSFHLQVLMEIKSLWDIRSALRATPHSTYLREQGQNQAPYGFFFTNNLSPKTQGTLYCILQSRCKVQFDSKEVHLIRYVYRLRYNSKSFISDIFSSIKHSAKHYMPLSLFCAFTTKTTVL